jgi:uncharacterized membrane protein
MTGLQFAFLAMVTTVCQHFALRRIGCSPGITMLTAVMVVAGGMLAVRYEPLRLPFGPRGWMFWILLGVFLGATRFFIAKSYQAGAGEAVVITVLSMAPVVSALLAGIIEWRLPTVRELVAACLVTAAVIVLVSGKEPSAK